MNGAAVLMVVACGGCTQAGGRTASVPSPLARQELRIAHGVAVELVWLPPGEFQMGSEPDEPDAGVDQRPKHLVKLTRGFWIGRYEITNRQYRCFRPEHRSAGLGGEKGDFNGDQQPVVCVSLDDARDFCRWVSERTGRKVRLPTEAEWEYACRAGTTTQFSFGDDPSRLDDYGWYAANSGGCSHPVGRKRANPWGLHDMHGNVAEWVSDVFAYYPGGPRVDPAGPPGQGQHFWRECSWSSQAYEARCAHRGDRGPSNHRAA